MMPSFGGLVAFLHKHPGLLDFNIASVVPHPYAYQLITGNKMDLGSFVRTGERIYNLERLINLRQGMTNADTLPDRLTKDPQKEESTTVQLDKMLPKYYKIRRWDKEGIPTGKLLKKLKIRF